MADAIAANEKPYMHPAQHLLKVTSFEPHAANKQLKKMHEDHSIKHVKFIEAHNRAFDDMHKAVRENRHEHAKAHYANAMNFKMRANGHGAMANAITHAQIGNQADALREAKNAGVYFNAYHGPKPDDNAHMSGGTRVVNTGGGNHTHSPGSLNSTKINAVEKTSEIRRTASFSSVPKISVASNPTAITPASAPFKVESASDTTVPFHTIDKDVLNDLVYLFQYVLGSRPELPNNTTIHAVIQKTMAEIGALKRV